MGSSDLGVLKVLGVLIQYQELSFQIIERYGKSYELAFQITERYIQCLGGTFSR